MNDLISRQAVLDIVDDLRDQMTVEGYCAMTERVKGLPSATCGNLEKPEIPQHSEGEAADCNLDCISRQMLLEYIHGEPVGKLLCDKYNLDGLIEQFPSVQPNLQPTCNQLATDCISRQAAIDIERNATVDTNPSHFEAHQKFTQFMDDAEISSFGRWQWSNGFNTALTAVGIDLKKLPSAQQTLYGYNIEHLDLIARVLQKEDLPPDRIVDALTDIGRIVEIVKDEYEEALRKAVEQCTI